jgi:hypothetical protein
MGGKYIMLRLDNILLVLILPRLLILPGKEKE